MMIDKAPAPSQTTISFTEEIRGLLRKRLLLLFATGVPASLVGFASAVYIYDNRSLLTQSRFFPWIEELTLLHPASIALGLFFVLFLRGSIRQLQWIDFLVLEFNILLLIFSFAAFSPGDLPDLHLAMVLMVHAAFLPTAVSTQVALVLTALLAYPLAQGLAYAFLPEVRSFWNGRGGVAELKHLLALGAVEGLLYGTLSVMINRTLYSMRKSLHKAMRLGNYLVQMELGSGGMGKVFVASHALLCRPTAVKVLRSDSPDSEGTKAALARFEREVQLSSTLTHPNTITIFDYGRSDNDTFYYAMEYLKGMDLKRLIEKFGPIPAPRAVHILLQVCGALIEAHEKGIIHRDIKPSNIFVTERGGVHDFVKVLDFGLAKKIEAVKTESGKIRPKELTQTGAFMGTPQYIAPETVQGMERLDARSDLYNLGCVAYWILTGQHLFAGSSNLQLIVDHVQTVPPKPSTVTEMPIPEELEKIVLRCLEKKPEHRYQTVRDLEDALKKILFENPWTQDKAREWWELHADDEPPTSSAAPQEKTAAIQPIKESVP